MQLKSVYLFSDQFTRLQGKECLGDSIQYHTTLQAAKVACMNNIECGCIYDRKCDGDQWFTSKGSAVYSDTAKSGTQESCTWTKSTIAFYSHIRKLKNKLIFKLCTSCIILSTYFDYRMLYWWRLCGKFGYLCVKRMSVWIKWQMYWKHGYLYGWGV